MSIQEQCSLKVPRSSFYHRSKVKGAPGDEMSMQGIDRIFMEESVFGTRGMTDGLRQQGYSVGRDRVRRLMRQMAIEPIYPKRRLSHPDKGSKIYPYLLRNLEIDRLNRVWCTDITYIPKGCGHVNLVAVADCYSRKVLSWRHSNTLDRAPSIEVLEEALSRYGNS